MASHPLTKMSAEEYLAIDRAAEFRSELLDGEMVAMSGGSMRHSQLGVNLIVELQTALRGRNCQAFNSDFRVRVSATTYTYPDATVVCGKPALADERQDVLLNPIVIFEVLSPSTERYDRGIKLQRYRAIDSLEDYILVDQNQMRVERYTRSSGNTWTLRDYAGADATSTIESIGVSLALHRLYERVEIPGE